MEALSGHGGTEARKKYAVPFWVSFAAVTDESGYFVIENVPTDRELTIVCWHESAKGEGKPGFLDPVGGTGEKITAKEDGPVTRDFVLQVK